MSTTFVSDEMVPYFTDIQYTQPLTKKEEQRLTRLIKQGDVEARNQLVTANLKFVANFAKNYVNRGIPYSDLVAEGNLGLIRAAHKFDESRNIKFISYAVWWIREAILGALEKNAKRVQCTNIDGLEYYAPAEDSPDFDVLVEDTGEDIVTSCSRRNAVEHLVTCLQERELKILTMYFGLFDNDEYTLEEISEEMSLTKERVRQIKDMAISKLCANAMLCDEFDAFKNLR